MSFERVSDNTLVDCVCKGSFAIRKSARREMLKRNMAKELLNIVAEQESLEEVDKTDYWHMLDAMKPDAAMNIENIMELYHSEDSELVKEAKRQIVCKFGKYVMYIMNSYFQQFTVKYESDLFNSGIVGLLEAMRNYDGTYAFTTYSKNFIIHEMMEFTHFITNIPSPHYARLQKKVKKAMSTLEMSGECGETAIKEISGMTSLSEKTVRREIDVINRTNFVYIDDPDCTEVLEMNVSNDPGEEAERNILVKQALKEISNLDADTRYVIVRKLIDQEEYSEIGKEIGLDIKQVKSIYSKGIYALNKKIRDL